MPACSSSLICAVLGDLAALPAAGRDALRQRVPLLMAYLAWVIDPRYPRGVRHSLTSLLAVAIAAALTSWAAIGEWVADARRGTEDVGVRYVPLRRVYEVPDEATIRDVLEQVDAVTFTAATSARLTGLAQMQADAEQAAAVPSKVESAQRRRPRREQSVMDGKSPRGTRHYTASGRPVQLPTACTGRHGAVVSQVAVDGKSNELSAFVPLLQPLDLRDAVVTAGPAHPA